VFAVGDRRVRGKAAVAGVVWLVRRRHPGDPLPDLRAGLAVVTQDDEAVLDQAVLRAAPAAVVGTAVVRKSRSPHTTGDDSPCLGPPPST